MSFFLIGLNHKTAPIEIREKVAFSKSEAGALALKVKALDGLEESLVLSTCNRTEVLAVTRNGYDPGATRQGILECLCAPRAIEPSVMTPHLYSHEDLGAVRHLFRVASSLDSMIVGEPQILGQVKEAYSVAVESGAIGPHLEQLLQKTFGVAKKVRTGTEISRRPVSIAYAAVDLACKIFGSLADRQVMVLGAGKMADLAVRHLIDTGARPPIVASRTIEHARDVASATGGTAIALDGFRSHLADVDIVICSTAAPHYLMNKADGVQLMKERRGRPVFFIDIAVPRDINPELNELDNLYLYDIDDLQKVVDAGREERRREADRAEEIVEAAVRRYRDRAAERVAAPTIVAMREKVREIADGELERYRTEIGAISEEQEAAIREMISSVVKKVLHGPTREIRRAGQDPGGEATLRIVKKMFDLPETEEDDDPGEPER